MKALVYAVGILLIAVVLTLVVREDPGYVLIAYRGWTVEMSLVLALALVVLAFAGMHYTLRLWAAVVAVPQRVRRWRARRRRFKARRTLVQGLLELAEGRWEKAERQLTAQARYSETPLINYLAAARAAQELGATARRDSYLDQARESTAKSGLAVGLAQAGLQLEQQQTEQALAILSHLHTLEPHHPQVLKLLMRLYVSVRDWEHLLGILPELKKRDVVSDEQAESLSMQAYRALLTAAGERRDALALRHLWQRVPRALQQSEEMLHDYARALLMQQPAPHNEVEAMLYEALRREYDDALIALYGQVESDDPARLLARAEQFLKGRERNPVLLLTLGSLCLRNKLWGKARAYLEASIGIAPRAETYRELGTLLERINEKNAAMECYRKAALLQTGAPPRPLSFPAPASLSGAGPLSAVKPVVL